MVGKSPPILAGQSRVRVPDVQVTILHTLTLCHHGLFAHGDTLGTRGSESDRFADTGGSVVPYLRCMIKNLKVAVPV